MQQLMDITKHTGFDVHKSYTEILFDEKRPLRTIKS